ncbi:MAG: energy-coupling factor transporter transmembrane protein EcfT [candidate division Zixibacteria bacterium]|nr:energy-coupling factor transporter transmembrane protein EcfT [candidate division Zixibacteria bacterium]
MLLGGRLLLGQYKPGDGLLYRLDPRSKILIVIMIMLAVLMQTSIVFYAILIASLFSWLFFSGPGWSQISGNLKPIFWLILFTALIHLVFSGKSDPQKLISIYSFSISKTAVLMAITFSMRILIFVLSTFLISLTTSPMAVSEGIISLIKPLRLVKIPVYDLGMILFIALRFIPVLSSEMEMIRKAQYIRGVSFSGKWMERVKNSVSLVVPVFFSALRRADDLSIAIETRGYKSGQPRSSLRPLKFSVSDILVLSLIVIVLSVYIIWSRWWQS